MKAMSNVRHQMVRRGPGDEEDHEDDVQRCATRWSVAAWGGSPIHVQGAAKRCGQKQGRLCPTGCRWCAGRKPDLHSQR
eukprot:3015092-Pyramimonas_sp.AAC.1